MAEWLLDVCGEYGKKLIDVVLMPEYIVDSGMDKNHFVNRSFCCGDEIILGIYDDVEKREVSFFHEQGLRHI